MAETIDIGYNTLIKTGTGSSAKTFAGVTSDDFTMSPETKESITKSNAGNKVVTVTKVPVTLAISGLCCTDSGTTALDRTDIIDLVNAKASFDVTYNIGSVVYAGTGYASGYKETTPADPEIDPTYTLDVTCPNGLTKQS